MNLNLSLVVFSQTILTCTSNLACRLIHAYSHLDSLRTKPVTLSVTSSSEISLSKQSIQFNSVQSLSLVWLFMTPGTAGRQALPSITNFWSLLKLMSIKSVMPSKHLILCYPLLLLPSILPSIRVFSNESVVYIGWSKYWSFSFSIRLSSEYSGLISFKIDRLELLAVQGTLKSLLQHHSSKASVLWCSAFFVVQYSHPYMTTGKTITWAIQTFVSKEISLLFFL